MASAIESQIQPSPFPAPSKTTSAVLSGRDTDITSISFADRILLIVSQTGSLAHWVHVPLAASTDPLNSGRLDSHDADNALLPLPHLTATTVLGGTKPDVEVLGQTLATTIASAILVKQPNEERTLVMGLGLVDVANIRKEAFDELIGAILDLL
ncbi:hypothetical protein AMS68_007523 [Peltaster fructicola]|uniref:Uncharacterized protein n=1 Tax=Peltaster fructicola TaxID=286661 RepID=A0A6H0Y4W6_9PEZI|nr:hypothetical protein AMS68_007523 [Peltaster fructicola]